MTSLKRIFLFLSAVCFAMSLVARTEVRFEILPSHFADSREGVTGAFCGTINDMLVIAGGCNYPDTAAADGGRKVYYDKVWLLSKSGWHEMTYQLPRAMAYGSYVNDSRGVVCIGGCNGIRSYSDMLLLTLDGVTSLTALPFALDNASATLADGYIYVVGGQSNGVPNSSVLRIAYPDGKAWETIATLPGQTRLQPACAVQGNGVGKALYVFGGYDPKSGKIARDVLALDLKTLQWNTHGDCRATAGMTSVSAGYSHVLFFGGVDRDIFSKALRGEVDGDYLLHPVSWYKFNEDILVYHTITNSWFSIPGRSFFARSGASLVSVQGGYILADGETKPGIQGNEVVKVTFHNERHFGTLNWTVLAVYLLGMLLLGMWFMRRERGSDDFFRGGGRVPWWAAGISIYATMLSAITYMTIPAKAYATDWTYYPILATILIVSFPVVRYYLPYFRRLNLTSAYEYLEQRFNLATRLMASALFIAFMVARMALVLYLPSLALAAVTGIDIRTCILLMGAVTIVYCTLGGVEAVIWGDVVQGVILVGGAFFAAGYLMLHTEGGASGWWQLAQADDKMRLFDWSLDYRRATFWVAILGGLANNLISCTSDQTVIQRYMTTDNERSAARSIWLNGAMCVAINIVFYCIGTGLYTFYKTHPAQLDFTMTQGDTILPFFMMSQLPQGVAGLLIAAIFAATMSTISSNINSVSTAFSVDFWQRFRPATSDRHMLVVARVMCVVSGLVGMMLALLMDTWSIHSLLDYFNSILGLLTSGLGGLFFIGIFLPRVGGRAALTGFVVGTVSVFLLQHYTDTSIFLFGAVGMAVSVAVAWLLSLIKK